MNDGEVTVSLSFFITGTQFLIHEENVISFRIFDDMKSQGARGDFTWEWPATAVRPVLDWKVDFCGK